MVLKKQFFSTCLELAKIYCGNTINPDIIDTFKVIYYLDLADNYAKDEQRAETLYSMYDVYKRLQIMRPHMSKYIDKNK